MSNCEHLKELHEAYALGALDAEERVELEAHLARGCPTCTAGVERARWVVAQLGYLAPEAELPRGLRRRVVEAASGALPMPERRRRVPTWEWVAAAALILLTVYSVYEARKSAQDIAALREQMRTAVSENARLQKERQAYERAMAILASPATRVATLKSSGAGLPELHAYWNAELGVVMAGQRIPAPAPGRTLQLWVVPKKGNPVSAGLFAPDADGRVLLVTSSEAKVTEAAALAISDEPAQGSPQPTTSPKWVGPVSE